MSFEYKLMRIQSGEDYMEILQHSFEMGFDIASTAVITERMAAGREVPTLLVFLKRKKLSSSAPPEEEGPLHKGDL